MIPLFAIGVFTGFTLSQAGLVVHWWRDRPPRWHYRGLVNGFGAVVTALATLVFLVSKFAQGAWVVVLLRASRRSYSFSCGSMRITSVPAWNWESGASRPNPSADARW